MQGKASITTDLQYNVNKQDLDACMECITLVYLKFNPFPTLTA